MTPAPHSIDTGALRNVRALHKRAEQFDEAWFGIDTDEAGAILDELDRLRAAEAAGKAREDGISIPGVDSQVLMVAQDLHQQEQPEWLFHHKEDRKTTYGRWSGHKGAAAYIRADLAIRAIAARAEIARLTDAGAKSCDDCGLNYCHCAADEERSAPPPPAAADRGVPGQDTLSAALDALLNVQSIISEGAAEGFNPAKSGDWPERLFLSQQKTSAAIKSCRAALATAPKAEDVRREAIQLNECKCASPDFRGNRMTLNGERACLQCGGAL